MEDETYAEKLIEKLESLWPHMAVAIICADYDVTKVEAKSIMVSNPEFTAQIKAAIITTEIVLLLKVLDKK